MPEIATIKKQPQSTLERVLVGIGRAPKELARKQERGILKIINRHIIPRLSTENQQKALANKTRIELWAKRAGIGLTATEIIAGTILSGMLFKKIKNHLAQSRNAPIGVPNFDLPPQVNTAIPEVIAPTLIEKTTAMITKPINKTVMQVKDVVQTARLKDSVRPFIIETVPTSMNVSPSILTKVYTAGGDATDFVSSGYHYLFYGNDQADFNIPRASMSDIETYLKKFPPPPLIHMNHQGAVGNALHLAEGTFGSRRLNRPFWHSTTLIPGIAGYDTFVSALERNSPVITASLLQDKPILASHQTYAEQIATLVNETKKYPWQYVGHGFDGPGSISTQAENYLKNLPAKDIDILFNSYNLWHPEHNQLREHALPTLAALLDRFISQEFAKKSFTRLFVPSPSHGKVASGHEPMHDAMIMQAFYPLIMPLVRVARNMEERAPYKVTLPGFSTSPILERPVRFFQPQEQHAINGYELPFELIKPGQLTKRGELLLEILRSLNGVDPLQIINMWRGKVFQHEIPTE